MVTGLPEALRRFAADQVVEIDVREELRTGKEPFSLIMAARGRVPPGGALSVRAIFEPVPLYAVMAKQGFIHHTEHLGDEDWRVWFYPAEQGSRTPGHDARPGNGEAERGDGQGVVILDVRGLEPPEPMVRTLAALERLPPGGTLLHINVRVPQFLLPQLEARGFSYEVREQGPDLVRLFIRPRPQD